MPFNLQVFKTRALTAVVFAVVMLAGLLINYWTFLLLFTIIHFGCWVEYQKLVGLIDLNYKDITPFHKYGVMLLGYGFMLWILNKAYAIGNIQLHAVGWWLVLIVAIALPVTEVLFGKKGGIKNAGYSLLGLLYISLSWGLMMDINGMDINGIGMVFKGPLLFIDFGWICRIVLIASIWINDTMAYIVGSFIGKTPFSKISPKKTWEGTIGGAILAIVVVSTVCYFIAINVKAAIGISTIAAIIGTAGDLLESKLKRLAKVKDSGSIMPGHGGFLDRFDSLLLATPFVWLYLKLFL
jgi:phosphatidate cytidylyltransferase